MKSSGFFFLGKPNYRDICVDTAHSQEGGMTAHMTDFFYKIKKSEWSKVHSDVVEMRRVELLSENTFTKISPGAVYGRNSLTVQPINKLQSSVAS